MRRGTSDTSTGPTSSRSTSAISGKRSIGLSAYGRWRLFAGWVTGCAATAADEAAPITPEAHRRVRRGDAAGPASAALVALRLRADLDDQINSNLWARGAAALNALSPGTNLVAVAVEDPEALRPMLDDSGAVLQTAGDVIGPAVLPAEVRRALHGLSWLERGLPGIDGPARMLVTLDRRRWKAARDRHGPVSA